MHSRKKRGLGHGLQCKTCLHVLWGLNKPQDRFETALTQNKFSIKKYLQIALHFPVLHCASFSKLWWLDNRNWVNCICVCMVGWIFFNVIEGFQFLCILKRSWISTWIGIFRKNYASSACCWYHLAAAQQIGLIAILSPDCVAVRIQKLILRNVKHISASFSS